MIGILSSLTQIQKDGSIAKIKLRCVSCRSIYFYYTRIKLKSAQYIIRR